MTVSVQAKLYESYLDDDLDEIIVSFKITKKDLGAQGIPLGVEGFWLTFYPYDPYKPSAPETQVNAVHDEAEMS